MSDLGSERDARFAAHVLRPARIIRWVCQMIIGAGLTVALVLKIYMLVLTDYQCTADGTTIGNAIRCTSALELTAYTLALVAAFDLAYLLFEDTMERAVRPLLMGLSATLLFILSGLTVETANWQIAMTIVALAAALTGGLAFRFWMRRSRGHGEAAGSGGAPSGEGERRNGI